MRGAIYQIYNKETGKRYIGSTKNYQNRKKSHLFELSNNKHCNKYLLNSWNKYKELTKNYSVSKSSISLIVKGQRWPHAGGPIKGKDYK